MQSYRQADALKFLKSDHKDWPTCSNRYSFYELGDEVDCVLVFEMIDKLYDMLVVDFIKNLQLFSG